MRKNNTLAPSKKLDLGRTETVRALNSAELLRAGGAAGSVGMSCCGECTGSGFLSCIHTN